MCYALRTGYTSSSWMLLVQAHMGRKPCGHTIVATQNDRNLTPVKRTLITVETRLLCLHQLRAAFLLLRASP